MGVFITISIVAAGLPADGPAHTGYGEAAVVLTLGVHFAIAADGSETLRAHLKARSVGDVILVFRTKKAGELIRAIVGGGRAGGGTNIITVGTRNADHSVEAIAIGGATFALPERTVARAGVICRVQRLRHFDRQPRALQRRNRMPF